MKAAGHRVSAAAEFTAGVQLGHHGLDAGDAFAGNFVDRDASTVVNDADAVVRQDRHFDMRGVAASASSTELSTIS